MGNTSWTTVEMGRMKDEERLREAVRERLVKLAYQAGGRRAPLYPILTKVVAALGRRLIAWGTRLQAAAGSWHAVTDSPCEG